MRTSVVLAAVLFVGSCGEPAPPPVDPPAPDTTAMEPPVAEKIESARQRVSSAPESAESWGQLGRIFQAHALYAEAVACYEPAMERAPRDRRWPYLAAMAQQKVDMSDALRFFEAAERLMPDHAAFYVNYGNALFQLGDVNDAARRYRRALELDAASTHALYGLAQVALAQGEADAALGHLRTAADLAPHHGEVQALLAQVLTRRGADEEARLAELRAKAGTAVTRAPDPLVEAMEDEAVSSRSFTDRGLRFAGQERFAEAEAAFRRVLEIRPGNARDYANLGGALARQGKLEEALKMYGKALELEPDDPWTRNNLAMALLDQGRVEEAAAQLEEALEVDPSYVEAHANLGLVRSRQGRVEEAIGRFEQALELEPASADTYVELGTAQASQGRLDEAMESWRRALALDGHQLSALYNLCVALAQRGEHEEAVSRLREGLRIAPNSSRLVSLLAWQLATAPNAGLRDGPQAVELARRIAQAYPSQPSALDVLAAALAESGDFDKAVQQAERGLELARASGQAGLARQIELRLAGYRSGRAYRSP